MSGIFAAASRSDRADITDYGDPDAPWNQAWDGQGGIVDWNDDVIREFRENSGKVGGAYAGGDLILPTTRGARSGRRHPVPLAPLYRGDVMFVSSFTEDRYPAWWYNIKVNPQVVVELRD